MHFPAEYILYTCTVNVYILYTCTVNVYILYTGTVNRHRCCFYFLKIHLFKINISFLKIQNRNNKKHPTKIYNLCPTSKTLWRWVVRAM